MPAIIRKILLRLFAQLLEKRANQISALLLQHPTHDDSLRMEHRLSKTRNASFRICSSVDHFANLCPITGPGTHGTRFDRHIKATFGQILSSDRGRCSRNSLHLGMCRRILQGLDQIVPPANHPIVPHHHRTDGNLPQIVCLVCFYQRLTHEKIISVLYVVHDKFIPLRSVQ